jgi:YdjC-like protein
MRTHLLLGLVFCFSLAAPAQTKTVAERLNPAGTFYSTTEQAAAHARPAEAEIEFRAQIERAMAVGIHPTHLDSYMGTAFATPDLWAAYVKVAHEYHLPFLAVKVTDDRARLLSLLSPRDVLFDNVVIANPPLQPQQWLKFYVDQIKNLKPGLTYMIVHLGHDDSELQAVMVDHPDFGAAWRSATSTQSAARISAGPARQPHHRHPLARPAKTG